MVILNWSRDGGDLRVAHFFALHAMQILPLLAMVLYWMLPNVQPNTSKRLVWLACAAYSGFCVFTLLQALHGNPFLA